MFLNTNDFKYKDVLYQNNSENSLDINIYILVLNFISLKIILDTYHEYLIIFKTYLT